MSNCILCGGRTTFLRKVRRSTIEECAYCGLGYTVNPPISDNLYSDNKTYHLKDYLNIQKYQENSFNHLAKIIDKVIPKGRLLEVGAGFGLFSSILARYKKYHIEVIEPNLSVHFITDNKEIIKHKESFDQFMESNTSKFNAIIFLDVLEHLPRPDKAIKEAKKVLVEGGCIVVQFPNYKSLMARMCKDWSWWMVEDHKYHFSPSSARALFQKNGYEITFLMTYENLYSFKKNLDGNFTNIKSNLLRKLVKSIVYTGFFPLYVIFRKVLWYFGYGGLIFMIAKRAD